MGIYLHHQNFSTLDVEKMTSFYKNVVGLEENMELGGSRVTNQGYNGDTRFLSADNGGQIHIIEKDPDNSLKTGKHVNPVVKGHLAFRVDNIQEVIGRLKEHNIPYADFGQWAIEGWHQIFFHDPDGNVVEVHQVSE